MRKTGTFVLAIMLLFIGFTNGAKQKNTTSQFNTLPAVQPDSPPGKVPPYILDSFLKKTYVPPDTTKKNFPQRLLNAFRFTKNARDNEKRRFKQLIDTLHLDKNLDLSMENVRLLDTALRRSDSTINSLIEQVAQLKSSFKISNDTQLAKISRAGKMIYQRDADVNKGLERLALKMHSILSYNDQKEAQLARAVRIAFIDSVRKKSDSIHKISEALPNGVVSRELRYIVKNRAEVYGIYSIAELNEVNSSRFNQLDYILLNSIPVTVNNLNKIDIAAEKIKAAEDYLTAALKANCKIGVTFQIESSDSTIMEDLLDKNTNQLRFIRNAMVLLSTLHASAVNIAVDQLPSTLESQFVRFIQRLSDIAQIQPQPIRVMVTLPADEHQYDFPLQQLEPYTDRFIIDYSRVYDRKFPGPSATLLGEQQFSIQTNSSWYKDQQIPFEKIVIQLPYRGSVWAFSKSFISNFLGYLPYNQIRERYEQSFFNYYKHYSPDSTIVMMDTVVNEDITAGIVIQTASGIKDTLPYLRFYYEDEISLGKKYQFILDNKMAGVAFHSLGDDNGYANLWDELTYRMADTVAVQGNADTLLLEKSRPDLSWYQKSKLYLDLFSYIMDHPCATCFENVQDTAVRNRLQQDMFKLGIDTMMKKENDLLKRKNEDTFRSHFEYVNHLLSELLEVITVTLSILLVILALAYILNLKYKGDDWNGKKRVGYSAIVVSVLLVLFFFSYMFSSDLLPYFGAKPSNNSGYSNDFATQLGATQSTSTDNNYCTPDPTSDCVDMPLSTLLLIVGTCLLLGYLVTRYLVVPVTKRKDLS